MTRARAVRPLVVALALIAGACGSSTATSSSSPPANSSTGLVGLFAIDAGSCASDTPTGSWFRMVQSGGDPTSGPFVPNADSTCADKTTSPIQPGIDGGLRTGGYQPQPSPPFDTNGGSTSASVIAPQAFFGVLFGVSTNPTDPQTNAPVAPPTITAADGKLSGDLSAVSVSWNSQQFNQGSPKPGATASTVTGTYDPTTKRYTLDWSSKVSGGPFDGFTGVWHLEGTFTPA